MPFAIRMMAERRDPSERTEPVQFPSSLIAGLADDPDIPSRKVLPAPVKASDVGRTSGTAMAARVIILVRPAEFERIRMGRGGSW